MESVGADRGGGTCAALAGPYGSSEEAKRACERINRERMARPPERYMQGYGCVGGG